MIQADAILKPTLRAITTCGGAACGHGDGAHRALTHEFEDVGLGEVTAEGFAGSPDGYRGLDLGFAFAGGEQFDGAARLLGDSAGLVDGVGGRSGLDGGKRAPWAGVLISMPSPSHVRGAGQRTKRDVF
jgi:hypothetical protein